MPNASGPSIILDVAPTAVEAWVINVTVKLRNGVVLTTPPAGSVEVTLSDLGETYPNSVTAVLGKANVNSAGQVSFSNVTGAYSSLYVWYSNLYELKAKHIPSGKEVKTWIWLDDQMGSGYASFDFPTMPRTWSE